MLAQIIGIIYVALLSCGVSLPYRLTVCDVLFPVMVVLLCAEVLRKRLSFTSQDKLLGVFLCWGFVATIAHIILSRIYLSNLFEWCIFLYCGVLFVYYRVFTLPRNVLLRIGSLILLAFCVCWLVDIFVPCFSQCYGKMEDTSMSFLAKRYCFTFTNPNLAAPYAALGALMVALGLDTARQKWPYLLLICASFLPMMFTVSKHGLLLLAVALYIISTMLPRKINKLPLVALLFVIFVFELTVLFVVFPLQAQAPFINTQPGMYNIHQRAYYRMLPGAALFGYSTDKLRELYPQKVDVEVARETLKYYNSEKDWASFCAYMDPHCEWLNLPVLFGIPALLCIVAFLIFTGRCNDLALYWVIAVAGCMLWDDVLSKRWIWIGLSLACANFSSQNTQNTQNTQKEEIRENVNEALQ